jgi:hypothetical protein
MPRIVNGRVVGACKLPSEHAVLHAPKLKMFMRAGATYPSVPSTADWTSAAAGVLGQVYENDKYGCCVEAEDGHYIGVLTGNAGALYTYTDTQILADYTALTGFSPSDPSTDQGTDPVADLNYRVSNGYADGSKDAGWAMVDATNPAEVMYAIYTFGNVKMWFGVPQSIVDSMPTSSGFVWDVSAGAPVANNGHCIGSYAFDVKQIQAVAVTAQGVVVATWGMLGLITWAALAAWFIPSQQGGLAVRVSADWVNKATGQDPDGVNVSAMISAFNLYFGQSLTVPTASPAPPPSPSSPVTLAQAQGWAANGINGDGFPLMLKSQAIAAANAGLAAGWPTS